jgi:hypothetical protein
MPEATTAPVEQRTSEQEQDDTAFERAEFVSAEMGLPTFLPDVAPDPERSHAP